MGRTVSSRVRESVLAFIMAAVLVRVVCVPALAQSNTAKDASLVTRYRSVPVANLASSNTIAGKYSMEASANGLSSLPAEAQGPISAALGKDDSGYWVRPSADGVSGENPQQGLAAEFTRHGAQVRKGNLRLELETRAYGYGDARHSLNAVAPHANANRVEYRWDGLTEWYENGPLGVEQGFTLAHRPGKANGQALTVELGLRGDLVAVLEPGAKALGLRSKDGKVVLRYTGLQARDATGRELRSRLEVQGKRLLVRVGDEGAQYPVVVDPWVQQAELTASDGALGDGFGRSVAVSGSTVVVGAPNHKVGSNTFQGAAYVFAQNGQTWTQQAELIASDGAAIDEFGLSVGVSGGTVIVGAPFHTVGSNFEQGAAYVFVESGGTWTQQAEVTASDGTLTERFGYSVAISGNTAIMGAPDKISGSNGLGAAYVFLESTGTWTQQAELTASDEAGGDEFGLSVAISGGTAVIGAGDKTVGSNQDQGVAYVFVGSGASWAQQAELIASDGGMTDTFGSSVAVNGGTAVIGAPLHKVGSNIQEGAAYVFAQSGGSWSQQAELTASDGVTMDNFGSSVAVSGSTAFVGSPSHTVGSNRDQGATYVFVDSGETWSQQAELTASDGGNSDDFGASVAVDGSTMTMGATGHTVGSTSQGAAYVFVQPVAPSFTLSANPSTLSVAQGSQGASTITITPVDGFSGSVSLSASGLPSGVTAAFSPNPATTTSTLKLTASGTATTGTATVIVSGTSGSLTETTTVALTVTATSGTTITLSPKSLNFGDEAIDTTSAAKTVTVENTGTATLDIRGIKASTGFAISAKTCGTTLAAGKTCKVGVTFKPTKLGAVTGTLSFADNASGSPQMVALAGTGIVQVTLAPASLTFPKTKVGTTSPVKNVTLRNNLPSILTGISFSTTGPFAVSTSTCSTTLDSKASCLISVTFSPTETGTATGLLEVSNSANNSPQTVSLAGTGD